MFLDSTIDMSNPNYMDKRIQYNNLGTIAGNITLKSNRVTIADITGNYTITLPVVIGRQTTCILDFTTDDASYPTITNSNIKIKDIENFVFTTTSDWRNRLIFTSFNNSDCWLVELERYGA